MSRLVVYTLAQCSTCRDAVKWLRARGLELEEKPIREIPPSKAELRTMRAAYDGEVRRLFNSSGIEYRALGIAAQLPGLSADQAIDLLAGNGRLVKRPFLIGPGVALVGFDAGRWADAFDRKS